MTDESDNLTDDSENHRRIGQLESERPVIFRRNDRSKSIGMGGQRGSECAKTECFLLPMLDYCAQTNVRGIKAIMIYPMNALATD